MRGVRCLGSQKFPTNYDGTYTKCPACRRKLKLHVNGRIPTHNTVSKRVTKERIEGGARFL